MIKRATLTYFFFTLVYLLAFMLYKTTDAAMEGMQITDAIIASMVAASFYLIWLFACTRKHPNLSKCIVLTLLILLWGPISITQKQAQEASGVFFFHPSFWVGLFVTIAICGVCEFQAQEYQEEKREEEIRKELGANKQSKP